MPGDSRSRTDAARETLLQRMTEMQRCMMSRLGPNMASDWLKLELTTPQLKTLFCLVVAGSEQPMSQLAQALGIGLPAATSLVDRLVEHGLVERAHSAADRRVVLVRPTEAGEDLTRRLRAFHEDQWRRTLTYIPDEQLALVTEAVLAMLDALRRQADDAERQQAAALEAPSPRAASPERTTADAPNPPSLAGAR